MHKIKNHIHNLVIFLSRAIYLHTSNQIASLVNQAKSMQSTKHDKSHALSLSHVSQALRYEPGSTSTRTKQALQIYYYANLSFLAPIIRQPPSALI